MNQDSLPQTGMVFGVFDGLHPGHQFFLREAAARCQTLIVVVALSEIVEKLKNRVPLYSYEDREQAIVSFDSHLTVVPSDSELGNWAVIKKHSPEIVFLGYDQQGLGQALDEIGMAHTSIDSYHPEKYKSELMNRK